MIAEYLTEKGAIGEDHAIPTRDITRELNITKRAIVSRVGDERKNGALICGKSTGGGGYYIPATMDEIIQQANKLEHGIKMRALALKPFRRVLKEYRDKGGENME